MRILWDALFVVAFILLAGYSAWQLVHLLFWRRLVARPAGKTAGQLSVAVLVPFRNEAENLPTIAATLLAQDYAGPTELIFINDHSEDGGEGLLPAGIRLLHLTDFLEGREVVAHKKASLTYGIGSTEAEVIVTTDADCDWPADRLRQLVTHFDHGAEVVLGPVLIRPGGGLCSAFQATDLAAYQFLTAAAVERGRPVLANGANFAFRRRLFAEVGGYEGVDHLPSGDDVLLLHKFMASYGAAPTKRVAYAPAAAVFTRPVAGWGALWRQRLRWASKAGAYTEPRLRVAQGLAFGVSLALVLALLLLPLHLRPRLLIGLWAGKMLIDFCCLWPVLRRFGQRGLGGWYLPVAVVYPFFLVGVGLAAILGFNSRWKGRKANGWLR